MCNRSTFVPTSYAQFPNVNTEFYSNAGRSYADGASYASLRDNRETLNAFAVPATVPTPQFNPGRAPAPDAWSDYQSINAQQQHQMDLKSLMPQNWQSAATQSLENPRNDWTRYTVTPEGYARYVSASGASRVMAIERSSLGRVVGLDNLLRSEPSTPITLGPDAVIFNDSSFRAALADPRYRNFYGCGQ
jgi:hypothetical protein